MYSKCIQTVRNKYKLYPFFNGNMYQIYGHLSGDLDLNKKMTFPGMKYETRIKSN